MFVPQNLKPATFNYFARKVKAGDFVFSWSGKNYSEGREWHEKHFTAFKWPEWNVWFNSEIYGRPWESTWRIINLFDYQSLPSPIHVGIVGRLITYRWCCMHEMCVNVSVNCVPSTTIDNSQAELYSLNYTYCLLFSRKREAILWNIFFAMHIRQSEIWKGEKGHVNKTEEVPHYLEI